MKVRCGQRPYLSKHPMLWQSASMKHGLRLIVAALAWAYAGVAAAAPTAPFDRSAWLADFEQIKSAITTNSPNLEWAAERGLDLAVVEARARSRLAAATDEATARSALERFVRNFGDGHMELRWPSAPGPALSTSAAAAPRSTCAELGYRSEDDSGAIATRLPNYQSSSPAGAHVAAGTVTIAGRTIGVLRIPIFAPSPVECAAALAELGLPLDAPCDEACADRVSRRTDRLFLDEVSTRLRALTARGADILLVDVAQNGGGSDTAIAIARMLAGPDVPTPALGLVRTEATARDLAEDEAVLRSGLANASPTEAVLLERLIASHQRARSEAAAPCDRAALWRGRNPGCSQTIRGAFFAGGLIDRDLPVESLEKPWAEIVSSTARFGRVERIWRGPLIMLVDGYSASSTELFGAMLQDAGQAVIMGSPSFGAGCGWVRPPQTVSLRNSGGQLSIPDCARFRRDGTNEVDGLQPDVLVGFRTSDSPQQRAQRLLARLPQALQSAAADRGR